MSEYEFNILLPFMLDITNIQTY